MTFRSLLTDTCSILSRTVTAGKQKTESWATTDTNVPCRKLTKDTIGADIGSDTAKNTTRLRVRFALLTSSNIAIRKRISHEGRIYEVVDVIAGRGASGVHHLIAVCEGVAGGV